MKLLFFSAMILVLVSCKGKSSKTDEPAKDTASGNTTVVPAVTPVTSKDTLVVDKAAAVYFLPDSAQMEKWKKSVGDKDFSTVTDDWSSYMNSASEYLKTTSTPVVDASGKKVIVFVKSGGAQSLVGIDTISNYWGYYLFDPAKDPQYADITMMQDAYKKYFK